MLWEVEDTMDMAGHRPFRQIAAHLYDTPEKTADREAAHARERAQYDAARKDLATLRQARRMTQAEVAERMGIQQSQVSRAEQQADLYLSTLARYVAALGGRVQIVGCFGGEEVYLDLDAL